MERELALLRHALGHRQRLIRSTLKVPCVCVNVKKKKKKREKLIMTIKWIPKKTSVFNRLYKFEGFLSDAIHLQSVPTRDFILIRINL